MIEQLRGIGGGELFVNLIQVIYSRQKAKIKINGDLMDEIEIGKGTRQGCPLSPLLFIFGSAVQISQR